MRKISNIIFFLAMGAVWMVFKVRNRLLITVYRVRELFRDIRYYSRILREEAREEEYEPHDPYNLKIPGK